MDSPLFMPERTGLQTEFYQLVQAAVYHADGLWGEATFDLFAKDLAPDHGYLVAAGMGPAIEGVLAMRFSEEDIHWLRSSPVFKGVPDRFFDSLRHFHFQGEIHAVPEGTVVFPDEPILRLTAPLPQAGLLETRLLQTIGHATAVATRASRMVEVAAGRPCIDFGSRRYPGAEAAWSAARAAWIGGFKATTNALASATLGIPEWGVMSDSLLAAYDDEEYAYQALCQHFPGRCHVNLPDEDLHDGVRRLASVREQVPVVRLDHRDLSTASLMLRRSLNRHQMPNTRVLATSQLSATDVQHLVQTRAPIDMFGIGGWLVHGPRPARLSYRIAQMIRGTDPSPVTSHYSAPWPGRKQVVRMKNYDVICLDVESLVFEAQGGTPLLQPVIVAGERVTRPEPLSAMRDRCADQLRSLPAAVRGLKGSPTRPLRPSDALSELAMRG